MAFMLLILFLLPLIYVYWAQNERFKRGKGVPGPYPLPIIGNTLTFVFLKSEELFDVIIDLKKKFGNLYRLYIGDEFWVVVSGPKDLEICLSNQKLLLKSNDYKFLEPWIGKGLLTSTGKAWHGRRKAITPAFHFKILEQFQSVIDHQTNVLVDKWRGNDGKVIDICFDLTLCTMDIICETSMGVSINAQTNPNVPYSKAVRNLIRIAHIRMFKAYLQPDFIFNLTNYSKEFNKSLKVIEDFNNEIIANRRKVLKEQGPATVETKTDDDNLYFGKKRQMALMDILLQSEIDGKPLTDAEIREEVNTFLFAGHDTTSSAMVFVLYNIAKYPEVQEKLLSEINQVFPRDGDQEVTFGKLADLQYMERVIKESLRIFSPVPMVGRESTEELTLSNGVVLPPRSNITLCPLLVQTDESNFPNPQEFNPDRFLSNDSSSPVDGKGFTYIPFSAGPRNCIGQRFAMQEMKIMTLRIVQNLKLEWPEDQPDVELITEIVLKPKNGMKLRISERKL